MDLSFITAEWLKKHDDGPDVIGCYGFVETFMDTIEDELMEAAMIRLSTTPELIPHSVEARAAALIKRLHAEIEELRITRNLHRAMVKGITINNDG